MPPRSSWKGFIRLSLVSVPVKAYTATATGSEIRLNQLHSECHSQIKYQKVCPIHGEVSNQEIVAGYQYSKGQFVEIDPEELSKLRAQSDKSVNIGGFFDAAEVDPIYYKGKSYYLVPEGPVGQKPYALLRKVMVEKGLYAIAQVVLSGKEQLVLLRPRNELIVMSALSFDNQIKKPESFEDEIVKAELSKEEVKLTETLIDASTLTEFDYAAYTDAYTENLTKLIEAKIEGKEIVSAPVAEEVQVVNLMDALKRSVNAAMEKSEERAPVSAKKKPARKMAPSTRQRAAKKRKKKA